MHYFISYKLDNKIHNQLANQKQVFYVDVVLIMRIYFQVNHLHVDQVYNVVIN